MSKNNYEFSMDTYIQQTLITGLFDNNDIISLLLKTLQYISWKEQSVHNSTKLKIIINKMNRVFYIFEKKYYSIGLPFCVKIENGKCEIKDSKTGIVIDNKLLSYIESFFKKYSQRTVSDIVSEFDQFFEDNPELNDNEKNNIIILSIYLLSFEYGYIRYEDDKERENGLLHPRYHLDINCRNECKYKIGIDHGIDDNWFYECLDTTKDCKMIKA